MITQTTGLVTERWIMWLPIARTSEWASACITVGADCNTILGVGQNRCAAGCCGGCQDPFAVVAVRVRVVQHVDLQIAAWTVIDDCGKHTIVTELRRRL